MEIEEHHDVAQVKLECGTQTKKHSKETVDGWFCCFVDIVSPYEKACMAKLPATRSRGFAVGGVVGDNSG